MGLREVLSKMKIVELDADELAAAAPPPAVPGFKAPPAPGTVDINDLLGSLPEAPAIDERKLAAASAAAGDSGHEVPDFPAIYKAAGVTDPPHGYNAYKVLEIFSSPGFAALDLRAKAAALTGFLNMNPSGPVPITDIVQDAVRRDQALDKFEEFLRGKQASRAQQVDKDNAKLQAEIDEVTHRNREAMESNRAALESEQVRLSRWLTLKRTEERKLFDAVNPFVEKNPISTTDTPPPAASAANPKGSPS
jgi:hypothetical protein